MKISFYRNHFGEMWFLGLTACWGEKDVVTVGVCLGWWEFGIKFSGGGK
jgi:hypothetical protein